MKKLILNVFVLGAFAGVLSISSCSDDDDGSDCYNMLKAEYEKFNDAYSEYEADDSNANCIAVAEAANNFFEVGDEQDDCDASEDEIDEATEWFTEVLAKALFLPCVEE